MTHVMHRQCRHCKANYKGSVRCPMCRKLDIKPRDFEHYYKPFDQLMWDRSLHPPAKVTQFTWNSGGVAFEFELGVHWERGGKRTPIQTPRRWLYSLLRVNIQKHFIDAFPEEYKTHIAECWRALPVIDVVAEFVFSDGYMKSTHFRINEPLEEQDTVWFDSLRDDTLDFAGDFQKFATGE